MLFRTFYDEKLAHASYLVGCQRTGEAIVVDPGRDVGQYVEAAMKEGLNLTAAAETHIHADYVSGVRELGVRFGAKLYLSDEGDENWKYEYASELEHQLVKDGDHFLIGNIEFEVMHTPGHTPESISFLVTDRGSQADMPMGIFTGDFVFVGDVGRPDLLEKAAGMSGTADTGAKSMFASLKRFKSLPDYLQVWPAHGAGSACGKALGAVPSSTVGYEKLMNWALQIEDEAEFMQELLAGQPEPPIYFAEMKRVNKIGPATSNQYGEIIQLSEDDLKDVLTSKQQVLDTREAASFAKKHVPGTFNIPGNKSFTNWAGWLVDYERPLYVLTDPADLQDTVRALRSVGIDRIAGFADAGAISDTLGTESYEEASPTELKARLDKGEATLIDVRNQSEWDEGHIEGARHIMLGTLKKRLSEIPFDRTVVLQCQSGARSGIAISYLQSQGYNHAVNMIGGYMQWQREIG